MVVSMDITFLGTGSAQPSATRNHQAMALRVDGDIWLFDCGEATQHQFQKSQLKMGKITRIFITHMHGDHCFGLGPLLCSMTDNLNPNQEAKGDEKPIEIYGPSPLRTWIRTTLKSTYSNLGRTYRVHELLHEHDPVDLQQDRHPNELEGQNVLIDNNKFDLPCFDGDYRVQAAPIEHSIPSLGYVIHEAEIPGKLDSLIPLIKKNAEALKAQGIKNPMSLLGQVQRTQKSYDLPDGSKLTPPPKRPGRQLVILGDTKDPSSLIPLVHRPTLLVHEATNALTRLDLDAKDPMTLEQVEERTKNHGHSTPQMAAHFAKKISCSKLILTHFSARYRGDEDPEAVEVMEEIRKLAVDVFDKRDQDVFCARDLWSFDIKLES
ncbi:beta-lactamase-like protein [Choanephora cucurbitarum]|nr:beta-lactamase-like protein [Choanephora cucurbitarum]